MFWNPFNMLCHPRTSLCIRIRSVDGVPTEEMGTSGVCPYMSAWYILVVILRAGPLWLDSYRTETNSCSVMSTTEFCSWVLFPNEVHIWIQMKFSHWFAPVNLKYGIMVIQSWMIWTYLELQEMHTDVTSEVGVNSLSTGHDGQRSAGDTLNEFSPMIAVFWFIFHWCLFPRLILK